MPPLEVSLVASVVLHVLDAWRLHVYGCLCVPPSIVADEAACGTGTHVLDPRVVLIYDRPPHSVLLALIWHVHCYVVDSARVHDSEHRAHCYP